MNNRIKIIHVLYSLEVGGTQTFVMNVYRNINKEKFEFIFVVSKKGVFDEEIINAGDTIEYIPYITEVGEKRYKECLKKIFLQYPDCKIVHSHIDQVSGIVMQAACESNIMIRISHSHTTQSNTNFVKRIYKNYLQKKILKYGNVFFACSKSAADFLFKKSDEVFVINNGICIEKFKFSNNIRKSIRNELGIADDVCLIGTVSRFTKSKNIQYLIKIFKRIYENNSKYRLILVGSGNQEKKLKKLVNNLNIQDVVFFTGMKGNVERFFSAMDVFVTTSKYEGLGITLIEAQTNGLPSFADMKAIPIEAKISKLLVLLNLDDGYDVWAKNIINMENNRINVVEDVIKARL